MIRDGSAQGLASLRLVAQRGMDDGEVVVDGEALRAAFAQPGDFRQRLLPATHEREGTAGSAMTAGSGIDARGELLERAPIVAFGDQDASQEIMREIETRLQLDYTPQFALGLVVVSLQVQQHAEVRTEQQAGRLELECTPGFAEGSDPYDRDRPC